MWLQKMHPFPENIMNDFESGLLKVLKDPRYVFMGMEDSCQDILKNHFSPEEACKILVLSKAYLIGGLVLALQKNSPYTEIINYR